MNGNSKKERIDSLVKRAVEEAIHEISFCDDSFRQLFLTGTRKDELEFLVAFRLTGNEYRFKELADIMAWKKGPRV